MYYSLDQYSVLKPVLMIKNPLHSVNDCPNKQDITSSSKLFSNSLLDTDA